MTDKYLTAEYFTVWDTRTGTILRTGTCPAGQGYRQAVKAWEQAEAGITTGLPNGTTAPAQAA